MPTNAEILKYRFFDYLRVLPFIDEIYVYGSRARGDYQEKSDLDLAIKCKPKSDFKDWRLVKIITNEACDTVLKIDTTKLDKFLDKAFVEEINRDKILLVKKGKKQTKNFIKLAKMKPYALKKVNRI